MSLLKSLLMDNKIFEAEEEVNNFIEKNKIEPGSYPQGLVFSKDIFIDEQQVKDFLIVHVFSELKINTSKSGYNVTIFESIGFIESTLQTIEVRDGVSLTVGVLKPMAADNPILFGIKEGESVKFSNELPYVIELANVVSGFHANFGEVSITEKDLISFKDNFDDQVVGVDLSIDFDHETREAAGWIKEVFLSDDNKQLFGVVRWTPKGAVALTDREFRYLSPEFHPNWVHPHTGIAHGPTLLGAALVNRPFLKMDAIVGLNQGKNKGVPDMETITLSDHNKKVVSLQEQINTLTLSEGTAVKTATNLQAKVTTLSDENKSLKDAADKKEKDAKHALLFSEGKINKAQLDALAEGKEMLDVLSLSAQLNTDPKGSNGADNSGNVKLSDEEKKMCKRMGLTEEEFFNANKEA